MRQVPDNKKITYLLVGNGKLSKHIQHYFNLLCIPFDIWTKSSTTDFKEAALKCDKILLLINDDMIELFISENITEELKDKIWVHFSGLLSVKEVESAHPLMTFGEELYDLETYKTIPFIIEEGKRKFQEIFPELDNPRYYILQDQKSMYHAFCVMSGNFTTILWQEFFVFLNSNNIPKKVAFPYIQKIFENLITSDSPLTGPLQRKDTKTISKHLKSINNAALRKIYLSFVELYDKTIMEKIP